MSEYNNNLFLDPKTKQYGSHMIMTNVHKPSKTKYVNVDTKFRDEYNYQQTTNYNITIPERITDVKNMCLTNIEIPMSFYNISSTLGNNSFNIIDPDTSNSVTIVIPNGQYSGSQLQTGINLLISQLSSPYSNLIYGYSDTGSSFHTSQSTLTIEFDVNGTGQSDKYNFKSKLGWLLGFRLLSYTVTTTTILSEAFPDLNGPRYVYLAIEEFNKGNQHSFVSPLSSSLINKNIIARITMDSHFPFGTVLPANRFNGLLVSDKRSYTGKIDLLKLNVQLLNENGGQLNLNGLDFSFCLEVEHE